MDNQVIQPDPSKVPQCRCKDENSVPCFAAHRISKTDKNKDRAFYACSVGADKGGCSFFCWVEDVYLDEKTGMARKKYIPLPDGYVKKPTAAETLIAHDLRLIHLEETIIQHQQRIAALEDKLRLHDEQQQQQPRAAKIQKTEPGRVPQGGRKQ